MEIAVPQLSECKTEAEYLLLAEHRWVTNVKKPFDDDTRHRSVVCWQLLQKLEAILQGYYDRGEIRSLLNGHFANHSDEGLWKWYLNPRTLAEKFALAISCGLHRGGVVDPLIEAVLSGVAMPEWEPLWNEVRYCDMCDNYMYWETNGTEFRPRTTGHHYLNLSPCKAADLLKPFTTTLCVTSGRIVVADSLRSAYPELEDDEDRPSINSVLGCVVLAKAYGDVNVAMGLCGNSSPYVYRLIGTDEYSIVAGEPGDNHEPVAHICTDLWWYMIADHDEYIARNGNMSDVDVVEVKNGVYQVTHIEHMNKRDFGGLLATIKRADDVVV